jgi:hypothetical protein
LGQSSSFSVFGGHDYGLGAAVRLQHDIPAQLNWYPTSTWFILFCSRYRCDFRPLYGFNAVSIFEGFVRLALCVTGGAMVPLSLGGKNTLADGPDVMTLGDQSIWTGK